jgi:hypothetical protein
VKPVLGCSAEGKDKDQEDGQRLLYGCLLVQRGQR